MSTHVAGFEDCLIYDDTSLVKACNYLHDARFNISQLDVDIKEGRFKASFEQDYLEDENKVITVWNVIFLKKISFPTVTIKLELSGISAYHITDNSDIGTYSFNECQIRRNEYTMVFNESMYILFTFRDKPQGNLDVLGLTDRKRNRYIFLSLIEIG